jgi:hypothetical protein
MRRSVAVAVLALAGCGASASDTASPDSPVPDEVVFDVCRAGWPNSPQDAPGESQKRFDNQANSWALTPAEREYVQHRCSRIAGKLVARYAKQSWKDIGLTQPNRTFPVSDQLDEINKKLREEAAAASNQH